MTKAEWNCEWLECKSGYKYYINVNPKDGLVTLDGYGENEDPIGAIEIPGEDWREIKDSVSDRFMIALLMNGK